MENMNAIVEQLVADVDIPEDVPVLYEVWAIGYDEEDCITDAELLIGTFDDPDEAVSFARDTTTADVLGLAEDDCYADFDNGVYAIHVEVETVVASDEDCTMNIGTIYKKILALFEEAPDFVCLSNDEYEVIELLKQENSYAVSLGERVLRAETASFSILSILWYELG
jgi:hypothetical protein